MVQTAIINKCDLCDSKDQVDYFCTNCEEILCLSCKFTHSKSKKTKNDKIISLTQMRHDGLAHRSTTVYCTEHSTEEITLFCLKCDQLICTHCVAGKHSGHNVTSPDEVKDSKAEELQKNIQTLKSKKAIYENAFKTEGQIHSQFTKSIDKVRNEISDQKAKIIVELNLVCDEQHAELSKLQQNEDKRYSDVCKEIQGQNQTVTSSLQGAEDSLASNNTALIIQAIMDTTNALQCLQHPTMSPTRIATYTPGERSRPTVRHMQGNVNISQTTPYLAGYDSSHQTFSQPQKKLYTEKGAKPKLITDIQKLQEQKRSSDNKKQQTKNVIEPREIKVMSTITFKNRNTIFIIVPLKNKTAWVATRHNKQLFLINSTGIIITTSVSLKDLIEDAKEYNDGLLVTCLSHCQVMKLSAGGESVSIFSDLSPYYTSGLCVTKDMMVTVCLRSSDHNKKKKVVTLNSFGQIIQIIQQDTTGVPLYRDPYRVTSLSSGNIIVLDNSQPRRIIEVDGEGQHLFTWKGEILGKKFGDKHVQHITHDNEDNLIVTDYSNNRVCVLGMDGSGTMCLLDSTQGINGPIGIAVDNAGQLWVGCSDGKIHIIQYSQTCCRGHLYIKDTSL